MDKMKFVLFSVVTLALVGLAWYWSINTLESGSEHKLRERAEELKTANQELETKVAELTEELALYKPKEEVKTEGTEEEVLETTQNNPTTQTQTTTTANKNQTLINDLQKLVDDNVSMKLKSSGTRVGTVQKFLNLYNNTSNKIDNDYGETTKKLVAAFQKDQGFTADGEAGPTTFKKMIEWLKKN